MGGLVAVFFKMGFGKGAQTCLAHLRKYCFFLPKDYSGVHPAAIEPQCAAYGVFKNFVENC